jgi:hypothetical protein
VTVPFTQNLVSIVFASSNASRDVSLRSTSALDSLELTARNFDMEAACLGLSRVQTERSGVALDGAKQALSQLNRALRAASLSPKRIPDELLRL